MGDPNTSAVSQELPKATVIELFEQHVHSSPDRPALVWQGHTVAYLTLYCEVIELASHLRALGLVQGGRVAISLERGFSLVTASLAVLKAGGVFLPVDPLYPLERRRIMLEDAAPDILITRSHILAKSGIVKGAKKTVCIDSWQSNRDKGETQIPNVERFPLLQAEDPAYVIYTSGSTGKPKGALNTHGGLLNLALQQISVFSVTSASRVLQFASFSFDASISEIVMALGGGATLVLADQELLVPGPALAQLLRENRISHITLPPSVLAVLPNGGFPDLEVVIVAGEPCPLELARRWGSHCRFFNAYGVSEAAVCSSIREFDPGLSSLPIGSAMGGVQLSVVDEQGDTVHPGNIGELYIGGKGVGLGYLNRPELTKEKFVTRRGPNGHKQRFYRSGDRVRLLLDGSLEYLGRLDNQVKVRGFRIELEEIALAIEGHDAVIQSAVVVRSDDGSHGQLVAYFKIDPALALDISDPSHRERFEYMVRDIRLLISNKLPIYMIPTFIIPLETFPLSGSGKVDLAALRARPIDRSASSNKELERITDTESEVLCLCSDLFKFELLPITSSFLDLGGDSLQAAQLAWRIVERFSVQISESDILDAKSLRDLSKGIDIKKQLELPTLACIPRGKPMDPTPSQEIFGLLDTLGVDTVPLNCCSAFEILGQLDLELLNTAYRAIFTRHESLRLKFLFIDDAFKVTASPDSAAALEVLDLRASREQELDLKTFFAEAERSRFGIRADLLVRCTLIRLTATRALFVLVAHHAIFDAWSLRVFMQDFFALLAGEKTGERFVQPLNVQFLDYVHWLHQSLSVRETSHHSEYLDRVFAQPLSLFELRDALPRPLVKSGKGLNTFTSFSTVETARLKAFCDGQQLTPFMVCTSLLAVALSFHCVHPDITIGGPVSIRYHRELERQIGLYGSAYVLRTVISRGETISSLLHRTRSDLIEAYRSQIISLTKTLQHYALALDLSRTAPYDVSVASIMFDMPLCDPEIANLLQISVRPYRFPLTTSFFDFEFTFHLFDGEIELECRYDTALYSPQQVNKLTGDFRQLLLAAIERPSVTVAELAAALT